MVVSDVESEHTAPFTQGELKHSFTSMEQLSATPPMEESITPHSSATSAMKS